MPAFASYASPDAQAAIRDYIRLLTNPDEVIEVENNLAPGTAQYQFTFWYFGNIVFSIVYLFAQPLSLLFLYNYYNNGSAWTII